jgi:hypothetical protein
VSESRQSPFFSRPAPGSPENDPQQVGYDDGQPASTFPDPPEWRTNSPLSGADDGMTQTRAAIPEGAPTPKPGVAAPVGQTDSSGNKKRIKNPTGSVGTKLFGFIELVVAVIILASIGVLFAALVYGRYEEFLSLAFWSLGGGLTLSLVLNLLGLFRQ